MMTLENISEKYLKKIDRASQLGKQVCKIRSREVQKYFKFGHIAPVHRNHGDCYGYVRTFFSLMCSALHTGVRNSNFVFEVDNFFFQICEEFNFPKSTWQRILKRKSAMVSVT